MLCIPRSASIHTRFAFRQFASHARSLHLCLIVLATLTSAVIAGETEPPCDPACQKTAVPPIVQDPTSCGDPVSMFTGAFDFEQTDLKIAGRGLDLAFERRYVSSTLVNGPLGNRWDFGWNQFIALTVRNDPTPAYPGPIGHTTTGGGASVSAHRTADAHYYDGSQRIDQFSKRAAGLSQVWASAPGYFAKLRHEPQVDLNVQAPARFIMRSADGTTFTFEDRDLGLNPFVFASVYRLSTIEDRKGNAIHFTYEDKTFGIYGYKRLDYVTDALGRVVDLSYDDQSQHPELVRSITDFAGRTVSFEYDGESNLIAVTGPAIVGTPTGNDFPLGRKTRYEYTTVNSYKSLLTRVFDANQSGAGGIPYIDNTYDLSGRVVKQVYGGTDASGVAAGGVHAFIYKHHSLPGIPTAIETGSYFKARETVNVDPNGNVMHILFDAQGKERQMFRYTGRVDPTTITAGMSVESVLATLTPPLRPDDPFRYETQKDYNDDGLITEIREPGTRVKKTYYSGADAFQRGNVIKVERFAVPADGSAPITTLMAYEPVYNQVRATVDPRGLDPNHQPPNGGAQSAARYTTKTLFDYQEGAFASSLAQSLKATWAIDTVQQSQIDVLNAAGAGITPIEQSCGLGDQNGDSIDDQDFGNAIVVIEPTARVYTDVDDPGSSYTDQLIVTERRFNAFSHLIGVTDSVGIATSYEYFPTSDPCGLSGSTVASASGGGFLGKSVLPEGVTEQHRYDLLGRQTLFVNGRGAETITTYNAANEVVQVENDRGYLAQSIFDAAGRVIARKRTNKEPVFDANGLPTGAEQSGASGALIVDTFAYDLNNNLIEENTQATSSVRLITRHRYDRAGNRVLTLYPEFANDPSNVVSTIYDERNLVWKETHGGLAPEFSNLLAHASVTTTPAVVTSPLASTTETTYDLAGQPTTVKDGEGKLWRSEYDRFERLVKTIDPLGNTVEKVLDAAGNEIETLTRELQGGAPGTLLSHTKQRFDEAGRLYQTDQALFSIGVAIALQDGPLSPGDGFVATRRLLDANGRAVVVVDDNRVSTTSVFDGLDRARSVTDALGNQVLTAYDKSSNVIRTESVEWNAAHTSSQSFVTRRFYDTLDRLVAVVDNLGQTTRYAYDSRGNQVFVSDAKSASANVALSALDPAGEHGSLPSLLINGHGNSTRYTFDDASRSRETIAYMRIGGLGGNAIDTNQAGDGLIVTEQGHDRNSRLTSQTDDNGNVTSYAYDVLNRPKTTTFEDGTSESLTHDKNGLVKTRTDANGTVTTNVYDAARRLESKTIALATGVLGTTAETMTYDGAGRTLTGADNDSSLTRAYDSLGRVVQETLNGRTTSSIYDGVGNLKSIVYPSGRRVVHGFDGLNRLLTVRDAASGTNLAEYRYSGPRRVETRDYPISGTRVAFAYDGVKRTTGTDHFRVGGGTTIDERSYAWDRASNKTSRTDLVSGLLHEYTYDSGYQLTASRRSGAGTTQQDIGYGLDGVGNREQVTGGPLAGTYAMSVSAPPADFQMNQYTSSPATSNAYDAAGNLVTMSGAKSAQVHYDYRNQMVEYHDLTAGETHVYRYDVLGRRTARVVDLGGPSETVTQYSYNAIHAIEEQNGSGVMTATFVYGRAIDEVLGMRRASQDYFFHADDMGNVMKVTNASAVVVESYDYRDYGEVLDGSTLAPLGASSIGNPLFFTGARLDDETGLYHLRSRYMDPIVGRFTTRDSIGIWGDKNNRGNGYTYAGCNPWTMIDPLGTDAVDFWNGCVQVCGFAIGAADNITIGAVSAVGELVHGEEAWNEVLDVTQTSRAVGDAAMTLVDVKSAVTAGFKGAAKGVDALAGIVSKGSDDLAKLGDDAAKAADKAADASKSAGKVETAATKADDAASDTASSGIYEFPDKQAPGATYVGQSGDVQSRLAQHERAGRLEPGTASTTPVPGDKTAREIAEHKRIQEHTGGVPAKNSPAVSNKRDPIGPKRCDLLDKK